MNANPENRPPVALTVAGSDSGGGAGIQADLLTFAANGVFGTTAITCLTAQNPDGVSAVEAMTPAFIAQQLRQVSEYFQINAAKTGMLFNTGIVEEVSGFFAAHPEIHLVVDPVMVATSGAVLLEDSAIEAMRTRLLPLATILTPNLDEARVLLGTTPANADEMTEAARALCEEFSTAVLLKGGHLESDMVRDVLARPQSPPEIFERPRLTGINTHGSGCTLSAAIAAGLARNLGLRDAVDLALHYLARSLRPGLLLGAESFIDHFPQD